MADAAESPTHHPSPGPEAPSHLARYRDIAKLLWKYGRGDLFRKGGLDEVLVDEDPGSPHGDPKELAADLEAMGATFIKLGQLLSTRTDLLPPEFMDALARLQDDVEPFPFEEVEKIVEEELGVRISKAFGSFEEKPLAAASLGQVHRATLRDGREVVLKVQRPGIREQVRSDLEMLASLATKFDRHTKTGRKLELSKVVEEIGRSLARELDYEQEARNLATLRANLAGFERIVVPEPFPDLSTDKVLTMEYLGGTKVTKLNPVVKTDLGGAELAEQLFRAYLQQILVDGFFHADPHPGNVLLTSDGRIALVDLGMVARITPSMQELLLQLLLAIAEGKGDEASQVAVQIGELTPSFDRVTFQHKVGDLVARHQGLDVGEIEVGRSVLEVTGIAGDCGIRFPPELTMLGKALLNLDQVGRTLDANFDPTASIRRNAGEILRQKLRKSLSTGSILGTFLQAKELIERLPDRLNKILSAIANNELRVKVDTINEQLLLEGLQKIANRITVGLILASMIVGAAMLMDVDTTFRILGYPGIAILFFLAAAGGGIFLVTTILWADRKVKRLS